MNKENILLIGIAVILIAVLIYSLSGFFINSNDTSNVDSNKFIKKTSSGEVTIDLTPSFDNGKLYVNIDVNTHTLDLSAYNLKELAMLEFDNTKIKPVSAPKLTGHHNSGQLIFDAGKDLDRFKIKIAGIPDIQERVFEWP